MSPAAGMRPEAKAVQSASADAKSDQKAGTFFIDGIFDGISIGRSEIVIAEFDSGSRTRDMTNVVKICQETPKKSDA